MKGNLEHLINFPHSIITLWCHRVCRSFTHYAWLTALYNKCILQMDVCSLSPTSSSSTDLISQDGRNISLIWIVSSVRVAWSPSRSRRLVCLPTLTRNFILSAWVGLQDRNNRQVQTHVETRVESSDVYLITLIKCGSNWWPCPFPTCLRD